MKIAPCVSERGGPSRGKGGSLRSKAETLQARPEQSGGLPERGEHFQSIIGIKAVATPAPHLFQNVFSICLPTDSCLLKQVYLKTESLLLSWK